MFNVPPIRDTHRDIRLRRLQEIAVIEPVAPYPRIERTGHSSDEPQRPEAVEQRLRQRRRGAPREDPAQHRAGGGADDGEHYLDEYA